MTAPSAPRFVASLRFGPKGATPEQLRELTQGVVLAWHTGWDEESLREYLTAGIEWFDQMPGGRAQEFHARLDPARLPNRFRRPDERAHCPTHPWTLQPCGVCTSEEFAAREPREAPSGGAAAARAAAVESRVASHAARGVRTLPAPLEPVRRCGSRPYRPDSDRQARDAKPRKPKPASPSPLRAVDEAEETERRRQLQALAAMLSPNHTATQNRTAS